MSIMYVGEFRSMGVTVNADGLLCRCCKEDSSELGPEGSHSHHTA